MISTSDFKTGLVIRWKGEPHEILSYQHVKMQQRAPIVRTKLAKLKGGAVTEQAFRSGEKVEDLYVERKEIQFLYHEGNLFHFMNTSDYQDITIDESMLGDKVQYLKDNDLVTGVYCDHTLVSIGLPPSVTLKVTHTEPGVRGDTAKGGTKPATVETGAIVRVPLFVNNEDVIKIDTRSGNYIERA